MTSMNSESKMKRIYQIFLFICALTSQDFILLQTIWNLLSHGKSYNATSVKNCTCFRDIYRRDTYILSIFSSKLLTFFDQRVNFCSNSSKLMSSKFCSKTCSLLLSRSKLFAESSSNSSKEIKRANFFSYLFN